VQPALSGSAEPELEFNGTKGDEIAVAEHGGLNGLGIDRSQGVWRRGDCKSSLALKFQSEVPVPNPVIVELQLVSRCTSDAERKMAGDQLIARFFS
jgi:hypothetical protein